MKTYKQKILIILFSLLIITLIGELCLRIAGYAYYKITTAHKSVDDKDVIKILCLGDSFCFGLGAPKRSSFPSQLEGLLNNNKGTGKEFVVYNLGIPGQNSSQVLKNIDHNINKYNPGIIILIIGMNDTNVIDSDYSLLKKTPFSLKECCLRLDIILNNLRIYEVLKWYIVKIKNYLEQRPIKIITSTEKKEKDKVVEYNLSQIYYICNKYNIKLVLIGYPFGNYQDEIRRKIALRFQIDFIEMHSLFSMLFQKKFYKPENLLSNDGNHSNSLGYRIMAEEIYKCIILKSDLIPLRYPVEKSTSHDKREQKELLHRERF